MIAHDSFALFDAVLTHLPMLAPPDAAVAPDAPLAADGPFLHQGAMPEGAGAIIAVIDHAIPFAHRLLTTAGGHSRVASVWLMDAPALDRRPDIAFGRELRGPMIEALARPGDTDAPYRACGLMAPPRAAPMLRAASHGAAVAAIAAGFDPGDARGRDHPVVAVSLPDFALADTSGSLGAVFVQAAVVFVIARARALARAMSARAGRRLRPPVVVNLSLGVTGGARDGSALIPRLQDAIAEAGFDDLGPVHFVLPMGNARQGRLRAVLAPGQAVGWQIAPDDATPNAVEIWAAPGAGLPQVTLTTPAGASAVTPANPGLCVLRDDSGREIARAALQNRRGAGCLTLIVAPTRGQRPGGRAAPAGLWRLALEPGCGDCAVAVNRDDALPGFAGQGRPSRLVAPGWAVRDVAGRWPVGDAAPPGCVIRRAGTANTLATGARQIRVGATRAQGGLAAYSALLGDGAAGDVTAPADRSGAVTGMTVPGLRGVQRLSGTSLSAPQLTRWLARQLAQGARFDSRDALARALGAAPGTVPDLGRPDLPWHCGL